MSSIEIIELSKIPKKKRTVVTGFAGAGFIGNTALMHAVRTEGLKQVGYLHSNSIPPMIILIEGKPKYSFRIYTDKADELMFLVTEAMLSAESAWAIGQELMTWLNRKGLDEVVAFEGFPFAQTGQNVFGFTTGKKNLQSYGIRPVTEGAISGINASLLHKAMKEDIPWTTIFVPTRVLGSVDYQGAANAIQILNKMFNLDIDFEPLNRMSEAIQRAARSQRQRQERKGGFLNRILPRNDDS
jgi:uncharacterized protein